VASSARRTTSYVCGCLPDSSQRGLIGFRRPVHPAVSTVPETYPEPRGAPSASWLPLASGEPTRDHAQTAAQHVQSALSAPADQQVPGRRPALPAAASTTFGPRWTSHARRPGDSVVLWHPSTGGSMQRRACAGIHPARGLVAPYRIATSRSALTCGPAVPVPTDGPVGQTRVPNEN
jgi:hypothetical protein